MCPPEHYGIEYEINPWMNRARQVDRPLATRQWEALRQVLEQCGARISTLEPVEGLPDLVFTANAAMIFRRQAVLSRFRHPQRQGEEPHDEQWLRGQGFEVLKLPEGQWFEGAGDALFCGDDLWAGYHIRSHARSLQTVGGLVSSRVMAVQLIDPYYYHLDTCFCPLAPGLALWHPPAFDAYARRAIEAHIGERIEVDDAEARRFACNAVVVGRHVVTNTGCPKLHAALRARGFEPIETPLDEFVKAGGSAKCLTLRLDGEEAARR